MLTVTVSSFTTTAALIRSKIKSDPDSAHAVNLPSNRAFIYSKVRDPFPVSAFFHDFFALGPWMQVTKNKCR